MARDADQQFGIIDTGDICREYGIIGRLLAQLVRLARQHPGQGVEPEGRGGDPRQDQLRPIEMDDMRRCARASALSQSGSTSTSARALSPTRRSNAASVSASSTIVGKRKA